jgi:hypothetical protein
MVRRPLLEPNLNASGLTFTGAALMVFLTASLLADKPPERLEHRLARRGTSALDSPGCRYFYFLSSFAGSPAPPEPQDAPKLPQVAGPGNSPATAAKPVQAAWKLPSLPVQIAVARTILLLSHWVLVLGMVLIGYRHFDNIQTGVAAASLYLLLPYTSQMSGRIDHVLPAAILVCAIATYRRPVFSGLLIGLVAGLIFYPLFLLPLWCSFYWRRGLIRFLAGASFSILLVVLLIVFLSGDAASLASQLRQMFAATIFSQAGADGFWQIHEFTYRIPVLAAFVVLAASLGLWPAQKNLGTLLCCSAGVMLGSQFWHVHQGGLYMAWYLPLLVLTVFRPNLEDRVAPSAVIEGRSTWVARLFARPAARNGDKPS